MTPSTTSGVIKFAPRTKFIVMFFAADIAIGVLGVLWVVSTGGL